jgi:RimJ/RimL family protein N-acetyltransferase
VIEPPEVVEHYLAAIAGGMRAFLLFDGGTFAGDADLRGFDGARAEFAFMIAARTAQGRGLGTRFATMIHALGFGQLALSTIYASIVPHNTASRRVFEKLGYVVDDSAAGRAYAEEPTDVVMSLARDVFTRAHAARLAEIQIGVR